MSSSINITRRDRKRTLKSGAVVTQTRWVLNYREPRTGRRRQLFFSRQKDAQAKRNEVVAQIETGSYADDRNREVTIAEATRRWLANRHGEVKDGTLAGYRQSASHIVGPLLVGTPLQRGNSHRPARSPTGRVSCRCWVTSRCGTSRRARSGHGTRPWPPRSAGTRRTAPRCS